MNRIQSLICLILLACSCSPGTDSAKQESPLAGTWELVWSRIDGEESSLYSRNVKVLTDNYFMWMDQNKNLRVDTIRTKLGILITHYGMGFGKYTYRDGTYTEYIENFSDPVYNGMVVPFTVELRGDTLYQVGTFPVFRAGEKISDIKLEEKRIRID
jgi:hypothetical protein